MSTWSLAIGPPRFDVTDGNAFCVLVVVSVGTRALVSHESRANHVRGVLSEPLNVSPRDGVFDTGTRWDRHEHDRRDKDTE